MATQAKQPIVRTDDIEKIRSELRNPLPRFSLRLVLVILVTVALLSWSVNGTEANIPEFVQGVPALVNFITRLMPPEFEFTDGTVYAYHLPSFSRRQLDVVPAAERARSASESALAELEEGQRVQYVLQETNDSPYQIITPEAAAAIDADAVAVLRPYIVDEGMSIVLDDSNGRDVIVVPEGLRSLNQRPYAEGQMVVASRYILESGEILLGYPEIITYIIETVQIAIIGTLGAILLSIPIALLAARNISPHPIVYQVTRLLMNLNRSIPSLIWALIMVSAVGLGPFAGVMALVIGSLGSNAKLYAESFEQIDPAQVAAVRATGAGPLQVFNFAVLPQAFPLLATYSLITFEANVRDSTILGIVGAGGVGFILQKYTQLFQFGRLMGAVIIIAIMVTIIDRISDWIRSKII